MTSTKDTVTPTPPPVEPDHGSGGIAASASAAGLRTQADMLDAASGNVYSAEEVKKFAGSLKVGEAGWVNLDEHGEPTGAASMKAPEPGKPAARVIMSETGIATSTGAPISKHMNPLPDPYDEGMRQRNPLPGVPQAPSMQDTHPKANPPPPAKK